MRIVFIFLTCLFVLQAYTQDTAKIKLKEWLGVLTLTEKYTNEKNGTKNDEAIVREHFQRLIKMKNEGVVVLAGRTQTELSNPEGWDL